MTLRTDDRFVPNGSDSLDSAFHEVLELARTRTRADVAWTSVVVDGAEVVEHVVGDEFDDIAVGSPVPVACSMAHERRSRTRADDPPLTDASGNGRTIGSFVAIPIQLDDAVPTGMLCCASSADRPTVARPDAVVLDLLGAAVARLRLRKGEVGPDSKESVWDRVVQVIDERRIQIVHQPIVGLVSFDIVGAEALSRFDSPPHRPDLWFAEAASVGLGAALELAAIATALDTIDLVPKRAYLSINASPDVLCSRELFDIVTASDPSRIVVELTEHAAMDDYLELVEAINALRDRGVRLAIDDVGAGYSSFNHVLRLDPDIVKLDMSLTRGIDHDVARRGLARGLLDVAHDIGATIVAEGVETQLELDALVDLGVDAAQGYLLARPAPLPLPDQTAMPRPTPRRIGAVDNLADPRDAWAHLGRLLIGDAGLEELTRPVLAAVLKRSGLESSYLTIRDPESGALEHRYVDNSGGIELPEGMVVPWDDTLCKRSRDAGILWTSDVPHDLAGCEAADALGVQTFVSIPIRRTDGAELGTLCGASTEVHTLDHTTITEIGTLAALIGDHISAHDGSA